MDDTRAAAFDPRPRASRLSFFSRATTSLPRADRRVGLAAAASRAAERSLVFPGSEAPEERLILFMVIAICALCG